MSLSVRYFCRERAEKVVVWLQAQSYSAHVESVNGVTYNVVVTGDVVRPSTLEAE